MKTPALALGLALSFGVGITGANPVQTGVQAGTDIMLSIF